MGRMQGNPESVQSAVKRSAGALALALMVFASGCALRPEPGSRTIHVSAAEGAAGLFAARDRARTMAKPVKIVLAPGVYPLAETFELGPADSGVEYSGGGGAVVSGGREIAKWTDNGDGTWSASVDWVAPDRENAFRAMYVGGVERMRARLPKQGFFGILGDDLPPGSRYDAKRPAFFYDPAEFKADWPGLENAEVVVFSFWTDNHLRIASVDAASGKATLVTPCAKAFDTDWSNDKSSGRRGRYVIENLPAAMTEPGEWYLDYAQKTVHYRPLPGEAIEGFVAEVPLVRELVAIRGTPAKDGAFAEDIVFRGIEFSCSQYELPPGRTNNEQASADVAAAVTLSGARRCRFEGCRFSRISGYALEFGRGTFGNTLASSRLSGLGGGGVRVDGGAFGCHRFEEASGNEIVDCLISDYGRSFRSSAGALLKNCEKTKVDHCTIRDGFYTGVSLGWSWGYHSTNCRLNEITSNHIYRIGRELLSDMGGIYTLGKNYGTRIAGNRIHEVRSHSYGGWGIYSDEGTTGIVIENNLVYDTKHAAYDIHYAKDVTVRNNIFAFGQIDQLSRTRTEAHISAYFTENIVYWERGELFHGDWNNAKEPFPLYVNPGDAANARKSVKNLYMDRNLFFNPGLPADAPLFGGKTLAERGRDGLDTHSVFADPKFANAKGRDFRLAPDSPAFKLGFIPVDWSCAGSRTFRGEME